MIVRYCRLGLAAEFRSEKIPRNRLGTASFIPRKKVLIPRHSGVYGRVYSEARNGRKWHEKNLLYKKSCSSKPNFQAVFVRDMLRNGIPTFISSAEWFGTEFRAFATNFLPGYRIPSIFLFCRTVRNFLFRGTAGIPPEYTCCSVYSVFRGIIFFVGNCQPYCRWHANNLPLTPPPAFLPALSLMKLWVRIQTPLETQ